MVLMRLPIAIRLRSYATSRADRPRTAIKPGSMRADGKNRLHSLQLPLLLRVYGYELWRHEERSSGGKRDGIKFSKKRTTPNRTRQSST
jgi:hypothetical protein